MEKHKSHHQKNDAFAKDGFKKYIKYERCEFEGCKYSNTMNHIHCIRPDCDYVVHASSQISSHRRKHERIILNNAAATPLQLPRKGAGVGQQESNFRQRQWDLTGCSEQSIFQPCDAESSDVSELNEMPQTQSSEKSFSLHISESSDNNYQGESIIEDKVSELLKKVTEGVEICLRKQSIRVVVEGEEEAAEAEGKGAKEDVQKTQSNTEEADGEELSNLLSEEVNPSLEFSPEETACHRVDCNGLMSAHFHCLWAGCPARLRKPNRQVTYSHLTQWGEHWLTHVWLANMAHYGAVSCDKQKCSLPNSTNLAHKHCVFYPLCKVVYKAVHNPVRLARHLALHDPRLNILWQNEFATDHSIRCFEQSPSTSSLYNGTDSKVLSNSSITRRRGRPPKYIRNIQVPRPDVPLNLCSDDHTLSNLELSMFLEPQVMPSEDAVVYRTIGGVKLYLTEESCPDDHCEYSLQEKEHFHCVQPRCFSASDDLNTINSHRQEFHSHIIIRPGFEYYDVSVDCRRPTCHSNKFNRHFHCIHTNCDYSFIRPATMEQHARKHEDVLMFQNVDLDSNETCELDRNEVTSEIEGVSNEEPILPLGFSPQAAANLPPLLQRPGVGTSHSTPKEDDVATGATSLPGFLPLWAAAMAAISSKSPSQSPTISATPRSSNILLTPKELPQNVEVCQELNPPSYIPSLYL